MEDQHSSGTLVEFEIAAAGMPPAGGFSFLVF
jgi:hypothetical protein